MTYWLVATDSLQSGDRLYRPPRSIAPTARSVGIVCSKCARAKPRVVALFKTIRAGEE